MSQKALHIEVPSNSDEGRRALRGAFGSFATGVTVITALHDDGRRAGLTVNSFSSLSLDPPLILWSIDNRQPTVEAFTPGSAFAVHVMAADQEELVMQFARAAEDKFAGVGISEGLNGVPVLDGAVTVFECRATANYPGGDHTIIVGEVCQFRHGGRAPILFSRGKFGRFVQGALPPEDI